MGKYEVFIGKDGNVYFRLKARNGEIICQSEAYTTAYGVPAAVKNAKDTIKSMRVTAAFARVVNKIK